MPTTANADLAEMRLRPSTLKLSNHSYGIAIGWHRRDDGVWQDYGTGNFGLYGIKSAGFDDVAYDTGLIVFQAAGNDRLDCPPRPDAPCDGPYDTIETEATAKNIITVCATTIRTG